MRPEPGEVWHVYYGRAYKIGMVKRRTAHGYFVRIPMPEYPGCRYLTIWMARYNLIKRVSSPLRLLASAADL